MWCLSHSLSQGLAVENGDVSFYKSLDPRIGSLSITPAEGYNPEPFLVAPVCTFDTFRLANGHQWVDVLKADIESAEFDWLLNTDLRQVLLCSIYTRTLYHE